jgi:hypothetical protein
MVRVIAAIPGLYGDEDLRQLQLNGPRVGRSYQARPPGRAPYGLLRSKRLANGLAYDARIADGIKQADLFLFLISPESVTEGRYTLTELGSPSGNGTTRIATYCPCHSIRSYSSIPQSRDHLEAGRQCSCRGNEHPMTRLFNARSPPTSRQGRQPSLWRGWTTCAYAKASASRMSSLHCFHHWTKR